MVTKQITEKLDQIQDLIDGLTMGTPIKGCSESHDNDSLIQLCINTVDPWVAQALRRHHMRVVDLEGYLEELRSMLEA